MRVMYQDKITEAEKTFNEMLVSKVEEVKTLFTKELEKRKVLENEAFKLYRHETGKYEEEWIPIAKHEEIVNLELEKQKAELLNKERINMEKSTQQVKRIEKYNLNYKMIKG